MAAAVRRILIPLLLCLATACAPLVVPPGPEIAAPAFEVAGENGTFRARDGARLLLRAWLPEKPPRAVLLALHGFDDHGGFMHRPAQRLTARGLAVYAYDQRGFGAAPHRGCWAGRDALTADLAAAVAVLRRRHAGLPLFVLGESMGAAVVMAAMTGPAPPAVDGVILAAPAVWGRRTMTAVQRRALWLMAHTLPWLSLSGRDLGIQASDNIDMLRALGRDPLVIKETRVDAIWGLTNLMDAALDAGPALILYGEKDQVIRPRPTIAMIRSLDLSRDLRLAIYADGWHMLLRDLAADVVLDDIAAWVADPAAALPSGADRRPWSVLTEAGRANRR